MNELTIKGRPVHLSRSFRTIDFGAARVLVNSQWEYVKLWLKRNEQDDALYFWQQAAEFRKASHVVNEFARALPAYYCMLNCAKALLECKGIRCSPYHGLSGDNAGRAYLANEWVELKASGVLVSFIELLSGEQPNPEKYNLKHLLRFLSFIHRAYYLTYASEPEIFIPVTHPKFLINKHSRDVSLAFHISNPRFSDEQSQKALPEQFRMSYQSQFGPCFRTDNVITWDTGKKKYEANIKRLLLFHTQVRPLFDLIVSDRPLWYVRKKSFTPPWPEPAIMFATMHRLSTIARYSPKRLMSFSNTRYYWLIQEFLNGALEQFIDRIASEITGQEFFRPGRRSVRESVA